MAKFSETVVVNTLVLVEDDDDDEFLFRRALRRAGIAPRVVRLYSGSGALDYFNSRGRFQQTTRESREVVFLDIKLPGSSVFDVLEALKDRQPAHRPFFVMLTSSDFPQDRKKAFDSGAHDYLVKPPTATALADLARKHGLQWPAESGG